MKELPRSQRLPELRIPALRADAQHTQLIANTHNAIP
jgi:hypothetical protein